MSESIMRRSSPACEEMQAVRQGDMLKVTRAAMTWALHKCRRMHVQVVAGSAAPGAAGAQAPRPACLRLVPEVGEGDEAEARAHTLHPRALVVCRRRQ